jgi:hypothetical protein
MTSKIHCIENLFSQFCEAVYDPLCVKESSYHYLRKLTANHVVCCYLLPLVC